MTNEETRVEIEKLKDNLKNNYAIYHERVTLLIELTSFEIEETRVNFKAKIIKPLDIEKAKPTGFYNTMKSKEEISFGASYLFGGEDSTPLLNGFRLGKPYCPFILWLDPELTQFVIDNKDEVTKQIPSYILWNEDWRVVQSNPVNQKREKVR